MVIPLIVDIANHITNLIDRTISSLALPDKSSGFCSKQKGKSRAEDSPKYDSLRLDGNGNSEHKSRSRYLRMNQIIINICLD